MTVQESLDSEKMAEIEAILLAISAELFEHRREWIAKIEAAGGGNQTWGILSHHFLGEGIWMLLRAQMPLPSIERLVEDTFDILTDEDLLEARMAIHNAKENKPAIIAGIKELGIQVCEKMAKKRAAH